MSIDVHTKYGRNVTRDDLSRAEEGEKERLLDADSDADEDTAFFVQNNSARGEIHTDGKITSVRIQIKEVTDVMRDNVKKVIERGERLEDLQEASDRLTVAGSEFREAARKAQRAAWMQNFRSRIIVMVVITILILCIIVLDITVLYLVLR